VQFEPEVNEYRDAERAFANVQNGVNYAQNAKNALLAPPPAPPPPPPAPAPKGGHHKRHGHHHGVILNES
jgi:hypothetical protein